jgi:formylglycine-generating enzyme required for sulfatase activity
MAEEVAQVRLALDAALDDWWRRGQLPPTLLLRDGLLALEGGHSLDDAQVALLLRASLAEHKGMLTSLKYQVDSERTALILADALLAPPPATLTLAELDGLRRRDDRSAAWLAALPEALLEETGSADAGRRQRASELLYELRSAWPLPPASYTGTIGEGGDDIPMWSSNSQQPPQPPAAPYAAFSPEPAEPAPRVRLSWVKAVFVLTPLLVIALGLLWWLQRGRLEGMEFVPKGTYPVSAEASGGAATVEAGAFAIDRSEVTIGAYRKCIAAGRCAQPASTAGVTRPNYLLDPAFSEYPIVNVDWPSAGDFCAWQDKRLPTAVEWEIAAGYAPSTQRQYLYPWGDQFQVQLANSAESEIGDTQQVASYQPAGDSPFGASDMAGNVAEWTATNVGKDPSAETGAPDRFLVKGGSFRDEAESLAVTAASIQDATYAAPWLGFRCAVDVSDDLAAERVAQPK